MANSPRARVPVIRSTQALSFRGTQVTHQHVHAYVPVVDMGVRQGTGQADGGQEPGYFHGPGQGAIQGA